MFKRIFECGAISEDEFHGYKENGKGATLKTMLNWMDQVNAGGNGKFLKCLNGSTKTGVAIYSIADITFSSEIVHKNALSPNGIKIAFVEEDPNVPAMTIARATELFNNIANLCQENGIDPDTVQVFAEAPNKKLTEFAWYYDTASDTAVIIKNMNWQVAAKFLKGATDIVVRATKTSTTPDSIIDKLAKIEAKMKDLEMQKNAAYVELDALPPQV